VDSFFNVTNAVYNSSIAPGGIIIFGFNLAYSGTNERSAGAFYPERTNLPDLVIKSKSDCGGVINGSIELALGLDGNLCRFNFGFCV
jgi:hypothetical protein